MKLVDGKCPYCSQPVGEKPGKADKQINCEGCGRLLNIPAKGSVSAALKGAQLKTFEPGLALSTLVGIGFASGSILFLAIAVGLSVVLMILLWTQDDLPGLPEPVKERVQGSAERLRIFPFELYLILIWALIMVLVLIKSYSLASYLFCFMMFISAMMSVQANRLHRESKVTSSKISFLDFPLFLAIMMNPSTAFDKRKSAGGEGFSQQHFFNAAAEKEEKEKIIAADHEEIARKRAVRNKERKAWEADIQYRYNQWLDDESTRLIQETRGR